MKEHQKQAYDLGHQCFTEGWSASKQQDELLKLMGKIDKIGGLSSEISQFFAQGLMAAVRENKKSQDDQD